MPFFGHLQVRIIAVLASFFVAITLLISICSVKEPNQQIFGPPSTKDNGIINFLRKAWRSAGRMPLQIKHVCVVQFFNWIGWFPFLFYFTQYVNQLYTNPIFASHPNMPKKQVDEVSDEGTRVGNIAYLAFAITSLISSTALPFVIVPAYEKSKLRISALSDPKSPAPMSPSEEAPLDLATSKLPGATTVGPPAAMLAPESASYFPVNPIIEPTVPKDESRSAQLARRLQIPGFSLRRAWLLSHILFACCMFLTFFIATPHGTYFLGGLVGVAWSLTVWAPFAIIAGEIAKRDDERRHRNAGRTQRMRLAHYDRPLVVAPRQPTNPHVYSSAPIGDDLINVENEESEEDAVNIQAGLILGLHNVAICAPQIVATLVSAAIFMTTQKPRGVPGDNSVAWVMRFGGLSAIVATMMTRRIYERANVVGFGETRFGGAVEKWWSRLGGRKVVSRVGMIWNGILGLLWVIVSPVVRIFTGGRKNGRSGEP
jgi:solute carrier family 45, member 1/2/4